MAPPANFTIVLKNQSGPGTFPAADIVSPDALALVRSGLRAADDPRIVNTVKVIDATLKTETATGPVWHRYTHDGYGEAADGSAFQGTGIGRGWPLLTGERAHYELAAGNRAEAERLFEVMGAQTSPGGLRPEQVWDAANIPERELFNGRPADSAMPLVWAHAEYLKLACSLADGAVCDTPPRPVQRYVNDEKGSSHGIWRFDHRCRKLAAGKTLRIETLPPARVHWCKGDWRTTTETETRDTGLGVHFVDLPTAELSAGGTIRLTFYRPQADRWENRDFEVVTAST